MFPKVGFKHWIYWSDSQMIQPQRHLWLRKALYILYSCTIRWIRHNCPFSKRKLNNFLKPTDYTSGGSKRSHPPTDQNFLKFMQCFGESWQICMLAPPPRRILDPPLYTVTWFLTKSGPNFLATRHFEITRKLCKWVESKSPKGRMK